MSAKDGKPDNTEDFEIDSISPGGDEPTSKGEDDSTVAELKKEIERLKSEYLYLRADFDNYRKAKIKEFSDQSKYGSKRLLAELLSILDTFERALSLEVTPDNVAAFKEGMQITNNELMKVLNEFGVKEIDILNKPFDPNTQEALSSEPTDEAPPGHVLRVFKKGYWLHDQLLRPAQVVVAQAPVKKTEE